MKKSKSYFKDEFRSMLASFKFSKRFFYIAGLEIGFIIATILGYALMAWRINSMAPRLRTIGQSLETGVDSFDMFMAQGLQNDVTKLYTEMFAYIILFVIFLLLAWVLFRLLIYCVTLQKRPSLKIYWRFLLLTLAWFVFFTAINFIIQYIIVKTFFEPRYINVFSQISVISITVFTLLMLFYLAIAMFTPLTATCSMPTAFRAFWNIGIKRIHLALLPIAFQIVVFILLNIVILILGKLPAQIFLILTTILMFWFIVWIRMYNTSVLYRSKGIEKTTPEHKVVTKKRNVIKRKESTKKKVIKKVKKK